ncbi:MAG: hypothetical protein A2W90_06720 [Bacteroidetes bacterium GWF2_42_66]|nr:MAG: hypothetical protein A2W92_01940 [Bacteroidetes bacterium GWA2_42_15]OFY02847.1 MAG: hypothetical protein A2W89_24130 [Bacteroidetes bacterium GWE2_42_39]OFY44501.1 MAG: hypothetical protein A2W90_06720 [Bacteroidetes bacterium GWF2_42_66]HAZ04651.1 hypothetical protein [Marinilabiliales bacterium]HBL74953.1 hypothetical protein [Prolixibacteraceae bacterium]
MKTIRTISKVTTIIAFVAFANVVLATGNLKVNILPLTSEKAVVAISNNTGSTFQISVENENGEILFYKETSDIATDYSKVYDFSRLEKGDYKLQVAIDGEKITRDFTIGRNNISVGKTRPVLDPYFSFKDNVLKISYLNFNEKDVNINFYNSSDIVYTKAAGNKFNVSEGFDLSKLENGNYSVSLSTVNDEYTYNFTIK